MIPVGVCKKKGKVAPPLRGPSEAGRAQTGAGIKNEEILLAPIEAEAGGIATKLLGGNGGGGGGRDAATGAPEVKFHGDAFGVGSWQARSRKFLWPTRRRSMR